MLNAALIEDNGTPNKCSYLKALTDVVTCFNTECDTCLSRRV